MSARHCFKIISLSIHSMEGSFQLVIIPENQQLTVPIFKKMSTDINSCSTTYQKMIHKVRNISDVLPLFLFLND